MPVPKFKINLIKPTLIPSLIWSPVIVALYFVYIFCFKITKSHELLIAFRVICSLLCAQFANCANDSGISVRSGLPNHPKYKTNYPLSLLPKSVVLVVIGRFYFIIFFKLFLMPCFSIENQSKFTLILFRLFKFKFAISEIFLFNFLCSFFSFTRYGIRIQSIS
jgi:hypothetical protein